MSGCCEAQRRAGPSGPTKTTPIIAGRGAPGDVVFVKGGQSFVGTHDPILVTDGEGPERPVTLADFYLEAETVSNRRFADFVAATGFVTESERFGFAAVFAGLMDRPEIAALNVTGTPWWARVDGANWREPEGPGSSIEDRLDHPVTQVTWNDADAFAAWVGGRLPSEAEWEHAARGGNRSRRFPWGDAEPTDEQIFCNIWQGRFPQTNTQRDGYYGTAPVRSFEPSETGLYNMAGNVWEWSADPFKVRSLTKAAKARNEQARKAGDRVLKGGSFLCHKSYCYRYRIAARMGLSPDSASSNTGFRIAYGAPMFGTG
ncbi:formylglycine-generating enzyme family protein [Rhizobium halophytocola]|uniref:Formylglycine-generating enzyme required for sulfatase activity n=1 Tax=Rhizobium halophytocola TaxID=735519 RepID=A0ABS4E4Z2_9HYPH|nr:formylglycine-generating enzyme family protein [Rhizobium halophytocola]MBP1852979.1 formylglycine-generating enzyme required for sulfatase activity [Rhizobium halophytocola]